MNVYTLGTVVRVIGTFANIPGGTVADPTVVKLSVRSPDGVVATYQYGGGIVVKDSTGVYHADLDAEQSGVWYYRWWSTGTGQASDEQRFEVDPVKAA